MPWTDYNKKVLDDFNRADENPIAGNWSVIGTSVGHRLLSNQIRSISDSAGGTYAGQISDGDVGLTYASGANRYVQILGRYFLDSAPSTYPLPDGNKSGYVWEIAFDLNTATLYRVDANVLTSLGASAWIEAVGDQFKLVMRGSSIQGWARTADGPWQLLVNAVSATYTTGFSGFFNRIAAQTFDDWFGWAAESRFDLTDHPNPYVRTAQVRRT